MTSLPDRLEDETQLESQLSEPSEAALQSLARAPGDILLLGVGGKMGPSLARMARRALRRVGGEHRVIGVSRFSQAGLEEALQRDGVETIRGDLLDEAFVRDLPDAENIIFMTGQKFGTAEDASATWAMNVFVPTLVCRRYPQSRILAFSTGNVYPLVPVESGGSKESEELNPVGEYGMSALGRERMFDYFSRRQSTQTAIIRLNYAVEMRYGILVDLAQQVLAEQPIDLSMGYANVIWQGDANAMALAALADADSPAFVVNVAGPELLSVREVCERFGELFDKPVQFAGEPAPTALLSNAEKAYDKYGRPRVTLDRLIEWTAGWLRQGGKTWNKPTHFQARDGRF